MHTMVTPCDTIVSNGSAWDPMLFHETLWDSNELHGDAFPGQKKIHGNAILKCTMVFWGGTIAPWYPMIQLIIMVPIYHPKHHGTFHYGINKVIPW
jgi:hypothetical protein